MIAAGVAMGFIALFFAMVSGFASGKGDSSASGICAIISLAMIVISYAMVTP